MKRIEAQVNVRSGNVTNEVLVGGLIVTSIVSFQERLKMNQNVANPLPPNFAEVLAVNIGNVVRKEIETVVPSGKFTNSRYKSFAILFISFG